ncbi:MAG: hypothetical protein K2X82_04185 [Gemmataceae bacterium]|nr:hypothetical protein [Gemmataceae bacterium]
MGIRHRAVGRLAASALALGLAWAAGPATGQELSGPEVAKRFIARQYEMTPVTGEFVIETAVRPDPERRAKMVASGWRPSPDNRVLKCRWAFDRDREVLDMLPGSSGVFSRLYIGPDGLVEGDSEKQYNLDKVRTVAVVRPGSFFFLNGRNDRWETVLTGPDAKLSAARVGETTVLTADQGGLRYELTLESDSLLLRSVRGSAGGKEIYAVDIHSYARDPEGRKAFPKEATLRVMNPKNAQFGRQEQLKALSVDFPKGRVTGGAFALTIPPGAAVADRLLDRAILTDKPTDAASLLANPSQAKSQPFAQDLPGLAVETEPEVPYDPNGWLTWYWTAALSVVAAVAAYAAVRYLVAKRRTAA